MLASVVDRLAHQLSATSIEELSALGHRLSLRAVEVMDAADSDGFGSGGAFVQTVSEAVLDAVDGWQGCVAELTRQAAHARIDAEARERRLAGELSEQTRRNAELEERCRRLIEVHADSPAAVPRRRLPPCQSLARAGAQAPLSSPAPRPLSPLRGLGATATPSAASVPLGQQNRLESAEREAERSRGVLRELRAELEAERQREADGYSHTLDLADQLATAKAAAEREKAAATAARER